MCVCVCCDVGQPCVFQVNSVTVQEMTYFETILTLQERSAAAFHTFLCTRYLSTCVSVTIGNNHLTHRLSAVCLINN